MKFDSVLFESIDFGSMPDTLRADWGKAQIEFWNKMAKRKGIKKTDKDYYDKFINFADRFRHEFRKPFEDTLKLPNFKEIEKRIML